MKKRPSLSAISPPEGTTIFPSGISTANAMPLTVSLASLVCTGGSPDDVDDAHAGED